MSDKSYDTFCKQYPKAEREYEEWRRNNSDVDDDEHTDKIDEIKEKYGVNGPWDWNPATRPLKK